MKKYLQNIHLKISFFYYYVLLILILLKSAIFVKYDFFNLVFYYKNQLLRR